MKLDMKELNKSLWLIAGIAWIALSLVYYNMFNFITTDYTYSLYRTHKYPSQIKAYNESADFLVNTPGCYIPNYAKTLKFKEPLDYQQTCGNRAIFVEKISDDSIRYLINWKKMRKYTKNTENITCCYQYVSRSTVLSKEDSQITYSSCVPFTNGTTVYLEKEIIKVTCRKDPSKKLKIIYEDAYIRLNKIINNKIGKNHRHWNVLIIGMDTMSRGRIRNSMPKTVSYLKQHDWLDYKGYQKVAFNTFPNLMAILTGNNMSTVYNNCKPTMDECRDSMIWKKFRETGYVTAYGEDFLRLPDTFSSYGFKTPPTDHYMRPFFLTGEKEIGNIVCAHNQPSASVILDYALDFVNTYKNEKFFGLFWINSYSHNKLNSPLLFDVKMAEFLEKLEHSGAYNNTFIIFLSDHGIRYGKLRFTMESYYEERLPMFFMWVPIEFRKHYEEKFYSLKLNHDRLTSHLDLHMTLWDILKMNNQSVKIINSEACPTCRSLFYEVSTSRTCSNAGISEKWCTCHQMVKANANDESTRRSLDLAVTDIQAITRKINTTACAKCSLLKLKSVLRSHFYSDINNYNTTFYVIAFLMSPGDVGFETKVMKNNNTYTIVETTETITEYNTRGNCVTNKSDRAYCVCERINKCT